MKYFILIFFIENSLYYFCEIILSWLQRINSIKIQDFILILYIILLFNTLIVFN